MIQIIPAIDIIDGRCVRLSQGDYSRQKVYDAVPEDMVRRYADCGVTRVHLVDLDGAKASGPRNLRTLEKLAGLSLVKLEWGGGIKDETALRSVFSAGGDYAVVGSTAALHPELFKVWLTAFGPGKMVLGADLKDGAVAVNGWLESTALGIDELVDAFLPCGLSQVICTDISRDGMLQGPSDGLYTRLQEKYPMVDFTVSGGIASMADIERLDASGLRKVIVGKAIYENRIALDDIRSFIEGR
ncbi:MAG: 1-(5-phosphoribosyl)-5-[(5-phosphoribosylamino)methylideneamino]imidazole-4-carboxamide isomerase [Bacteroidales bacterium]|nr:1-(5-phosphoribosyl)-5-[(5-phosphoribosylamino)methylideneamino]imidazole-4-carboxamide isomerase [Bacteroidales bacterium]